MRIINVFMFAFIGACAALTFMACTSGDLGGANAAVQGAGAACTVDTDCAQGLECEHGACKADDDDQGENENENENEDEHDAGTATACTLSTDCPTGQVCDDGRCKVDDRGDDGSGDNSGPGGDDGGGHDGSDG